MKTLTLKVEWKTNEYYDVEAVTVILNDDKLKAIKKSQELLKANPDIDSIRVRIDEKHMATNNGDYRLSVGFIMVGSGDALYFTGQDSFDSQYQVETDSFEL